MIDTILLVLAIIFFIASLSFIILALSNRYLPRWFCDHMGWHLAPTSQGFDGCSATGVCPRCGKSVLQDGQGNWF